MWIWKNKPLKPARKPWPSGGVCKIPQTPQYRLEELPHHALFAVQELRVIHYKKECCIFWPLARNPNYSCFSHPNCIYVLKCYHNDSCIHAVFYYLFLQVISTAVKGEVFTQAFFTLKLLKSGQIADSWVQIDISAHESDPSALKIIWWGGKKIPWQEVGLFSQNCS